MIGAGVTLKKPVVCVCFMSVIVCTCVRSSEKHLSKIHLLFHGGRCHHLNKELKQNGNNLTSTNQLFSWLNYYNFINYFEYILRFPHFFSTTVSIHKTAKKGMLFHTSQLTSRCFKWCFKSILMRKEKKHCLKNEAIAFQSDSEYSLVKRIDYEKQMETRQNKRFKCKQILKELHPGSCECMRLQGFR